ncbi:hypothetical protein H0H92_012652 [Tricholoma furcatifolium]|nr:hypothetical protein H0H92_012652 [Tricholoma furcatifolium]
MDSAPISSMKRKRTEQVNVSRHHQECRRSFDLGVLLEQAIACPLEDIDDVPEALTSVHTEKALNELEEPRVEALSDQNTPQDDSVAVNADHGIKRRRIGVQITASIDLHTGKYKTVEKRRQAAAAKARKQRKRIAHATQDVYAAPTTTPSSAIRAASAASSRTVEFQTETLRAATPGYTGSRLDPSMQKKSWTLKECMDAGYEYIAWDGRTPHLLTDCEGRVAIILAGQPNKDWDRVSQEAARSLDEFRMKAIERGVLMENYTDNRRGNFHAIASGVSMGGGRTEPGEFVHSPGLRALIDELLEKQEIQQIAYFQSMSLPYGEPHRTRIIETLFVYAPKFYTWLCSKLEPVMSQFKRKLPKSIFPAITFNVGPQTQCFMHIDQNNLAHGLCAITALGNYNPLTSGHFILRIDAQTRLVIEFPPGSTLYIPSATMPHGNTPVHEGETRFSLTQYCAGGLIRWVDYGFKTAKSLCSTKAGQDQRAKLDGPPGARWRWALGLFSVIGQLDNDRRAMHTVRDKCNVF